MTGYGRLFTAEDGSAMPQHRWELWEVADAVVEGDPSRVGEPLVSFVGPEGFWEFQAGLWEEQVIERLRVRPERLYWYRDGAPVAGVEVVLG